MMMAAMMELSSTVSIDGSIVEKENEVMRLMRRAELSDQRASKKSTPGLILVMRRRRICCYSAATYAPPIFFYEDIFVRLYNVEQEIFDTCVRSCMTRRSVNNN